MGLGVGFVLGLCLGVGLGVLAKTMQGRGWGGVSASRCRLLTARPAGQYRAPCAQAGELCVTPDQGPLDGRCVMKATELGKL